MFVCVEICMNVRKIRGNVRRFRFEGEMARKKIKKLGEF